MVERIDLGQARKRAKELVRAGAQPKLADAQLTIARELGFSSWPALVHQVEDERATRAERAARFIELATVGRLDAARRLLAADPGLAWEPFAALVLGESAACRAVDFARAEGGPRDWQPLLYVCHSAFLATERKEAVVRCARELLAAGADANTAADSPDWPGSRWTPLYGAAGRAHDPELTTLLLEAGADPDDGESLYHAAEAESPECLRILLEHGASPAGTNALAHALDYEHLEHVQLLLEHGADPNEGAIVAHAVRRGRGPEFVRLLAEHGADLEHPGGETWRGDVRRRTPYQHAVLRGRDELAESLARLGATTEIVPSDLAIAAVARGERPTTRLADELDPDAQEVLILSALRGQLELVVDVVGPNFHGVVGGSPEGSLLHHAAWVGGPEIVRDLLARGAVPTAGAGAEIGSPLSWAVHGSQYHQLPGRDYVAVAQLLVGAGNDVEPTFLDAAHGQLVDWLAETGGSLK